MLTQIIQCFKEFRDTMYNSFHRRKDAAMELVDSISSNTTATSVVELSLNPLHRRNYCSITRVLDEYQPSDEVEIAQHNAAYTQLLSKLCLSEQKRSHHLFVVDCTPAPRKFSPTLEDRGYVYAPNAVRGNKPVTIGHKYSIAAYLPEKAAGDPPWLIPLACDRVNTAQKGALVGMKQIAACINSQPKFADMLCVSVGDTEYSTPLCLWKAKENHNQVHISRGKSNRNFYYPHVVESPCEASRGRKKVYGDIHKLGDDTTWRDPDELLEFRACSASGKLQIIKIMGWHTIIMRGKRNCKLSDYPFRLLRVSIYKESGELIFNRPLWITAAGEKRCELSLFEIFNAYRQRFDIEHFFRFGKNRLLLDKIQTPDTKHEESWWQIVMLAYAQLFLARNLANNTPNSWEKYLAVFKKNAPTKTPTQVQKDFGRIIAEIGTPARQPKTPKKSKGRQFGQLHGKRLHHPVIKKGKKGTVNKVMAA